MVVSGIVKTARKADSDSCADEGRARKRAKASDSTEGCEGLAARPRIAQKETVEKAESCADECEAVDRFGMTVKDRAVIVSVPCSIHSRKPTLHS